MACCSVTLSANAGISLIFPTLRILVDAVHNDPQNGFSVVSQALFDAMMMHPDFQEPDLLFFSHCHGDHYSGALTETLMEAWPDAPLLMPEQDFPGQILLIGKQQEFLVNGVSLRFIRLPHDGTNYGSTPLYALLADADGFRVLIPGDCRIACPVLEEAISGIPIDLAILNFPWATLGRGRRFLENVMKPAHVLLYHLPFPEDDLYGYRKNAERFSRELKLPDVRLLDEPLQNERIIY